MERLQKFMASHGVASRRKCEQIISEGRVTVNGRVITELGTKIDPERDAVKVDGKLIHRDEPKVYIMLNKPAGYLTAMGEGKGDRPLVKDLLKGVKVRVFPVGRLDYHTEGALLLTNDGEVAYRLTHPRYGVPRTYEAKVKGVPDEEDLKSLADGVPLDDGITKPAEVKLIGRGSKNGVLKITISEGRNRQVRRMCEAIGHPVIKLKRKSIGPLKLRGLSPGEYRYLTPPEIKALRKLVEL
ncbi:MAG: pseudouridine synthase [bacterium]